MGAMIPIGIKVVVAGLLGFGLRKTGLVSGQLASHLGKLLLLVIAPLAILGAASQPHSGQMGSTLTTAAVISAVYFLAAILLAIAVSKVFGFRQPEGRAFVCLSTFPNMTYIGIPLVTEMFGPAGLMCAVVGNLMFNLVFFTFAEAYMGTAGKASLKALIKSPVVLACLAAVVLFLTQLPVPSPVVSGLAVVSWVMGPLAMMIVGFGLAEAYLGDLIRNGLGYLASFLRLIFWPLVVLSLGRLVGLDPLAVGVMAVLFGLPCGTMTVILAARDRVAYSFTAGAVVQSNVLMFASLPLVFWLVTAWV